MHHPPNKAISPLPDTDTDNIAQPHDNFFKLLVSHPARAGALLWEHLPEEVTRSLSGKLPRLADASFVDRQLRDHLSDRLFEVETIDRQTAFLYILIEHKSTPDRKVAWQLLKYMVEILKQWERNNPKWKRLPAIVPFVFYHGFSKWRIPREFLSLVNTQEAWKPYLLNFRFPLVDLGKIPDPELSRDRRLYPWLVAMKYAPRKDQQMAIIEQLIAALKDAPEDLYSIAFYLVRVYGYDKKTLQHILRAVQPEEEEKMMSQFAQDIERTVRQKALTEGIQQGRQEGRQEGLMEGEARGEAKLLLNLLSRRFQPLPDGVSERIHGANPNTIEIWADRVLDAKSLGEVFRD